MPPTYSTSDNSGTTSGDISTSSVGSSTFSSDANPTHPNDLYNSENKLPTISNRIPQEPSVNREMTPPTTPNRPPFKKPLPQPQKPQKPQKHPYPNRPPHNYDIDRPDVRHPYPLGPDPFPDYFPQPHPPYHFHLNHYDDKFSHNFPGIYAPNAPSMHSTDRYYPYPMGGFYGGRHPQKPNRQNGYQVTEHVPDVPKGRRE